MMSIHEKPPVITTEVREILIGMTHDQIRTAGMMITAKVDGKLVRRFGESGAFDYVEKDGEFSMITVSKDPAHEFAGAANRKDPQNPDIPLLLYFTNLRGSTPENYKLMAEVIKERGFPFQFDYVTGIPDTGNYIAKPLAKLLGVPYYEILEKSTEGVDRTFVVREFQEGEGPTPGTKALVVDDLITKAKTKFDAEQELTDAGFEVAGHAVVLDREEGGVGQMQNAGKKITSGITATQLFAVALASKLVSKEVYEKIMGNIDSFKSNNPSL